jgi:Arc/MetJ-type ribon-helix-helix transcriptional regulator
MRTTNITTVSIPKSLANKVRELCRGTGFTSLSSFVVYVLRQIVSEKDIDEKGFSKKDEEIIKQRLRSLGYIG